MKFHRQKSDSGGPKVPAYIVTFSDMVTLLLTFFVMLLSLAHVQDPELYGKGRDAFLESVRCVGLGMLMGREGTPALGDFKPKHQIENPEETTDRRTIDERVEQAHRTLDELRKLIRIVPPQTTARKTSFTVASVHFPPGRADLDISARKFLTRFCRDLQQDVSRRGVELYVLGLAPHERNPRGKWLLSAQRAEAVAAFLRDTLSSSSGIGSRTSLLPNRAPLPIYSWGAGQGGDWVGPDSPFSEQSQILIGIMRTND